MIKAVNHVAISTPDVARLSAFYREHLGFTYSHDFAWQAGNGALDRVTGLTGSSAQMVMLQLGDLRLEIFEYHSPEPATSPTRRPVCDHGITHICLEVDDMDAEYSRLISAGMTFHCPPERLGDTVLATYGRDPDGNVVELVAYRR